MNIENKVAADELRSHRKLANDVMKLEKEAKQAAKFDRLVKCLEDHIEVCDFYGWGTDEKKRFLAECKELQK